MSAKNQAMEKFPFEKAYLLTSGEYVSGKAAFELLLDEGMSLQNALDMTVKDYVSGKEIADFVKENEVL
jgi:hypothetical protein